MYNGGDGTQDWPRCGLETPDDSILGRITIIELDDR